MTGAHEVATKAAEKATSESARKETESKARVNEIEAQAKRTENATAPTETEAKARRVDNHQQTDKNLTVLPEALPPPPAPPCVLFPVAWWSGPLPVAPSVAVS